MLFCGHADRRNFPVGYDAAPLRQQPNLVVVPNHHDDGASKMSGAKSLINVAVAWPLREYTDEERENERGR